MKFILSLVCLIIPTIINCEIKTENQISESVGETVISADAILHSYYNDVVSTNNTNICSFETFCNEYRSSNIVIDEFTRLACDDPELKFTKKIDYSYKILKASSSPQADYIINAVNYGSNPTPNDDFKRLPVYKNMYLYSSLSQCDILDETLTILCDIGHTACISTTQAKSSSGFTFIQTIEAVDPVVSYGFLDDERIAKYGINVYRYFKNLSMQNVSNILTFLKAQIGKKYNLDSTRKNFDINSEKWYCTELVEAAYYYAGITLNVIATDGTKIKNNGSMIPDNIHYCVFLRNIKNFANNHAYFSIDSYNNGFLGIGSYWNINIINNTYNDFNIIYNTKMCFTLDGRNWKNLTDTKKIAIPSYSSIKVKIYTNFAAGAIAMCREGNFSVGNKTIKGKAITFADRLTTGGYLMERYTYDNSILKNL